VTVCWEKRAERIQPKEGEAHQHDSAKTAFADKSARLFKPDLLDVINDLFGTVQRNSKGSIPVTSDSVVSGI
jgi:hypothetical protein